MRPDFQTDFFWASSIRSKLGGNLSAVAISRRNSFFEWAPLILYGRHSFYMGAAHLLLHKDPAENPYCMGVEFCWDSRIETGFIYVPKSDETFQYSIDYNYPEIIMCAYGAGT